MAWSDLASNQMVSFTDAQTSGFSLKPGQSHVTSNQCMTSSDITTKYNVAISGSYSSNQLVPKSAWTAAKSVTFSSWYTSTGSTGQANTSGTVTIVGANATFNAYATVFSGSGFTVNTSITINGNTRSASKTGIGTATSTTFTLAPGTYSYNIGVGYTGTSGFGGGGIQYTQ